MHIIFKRFSLIAILLCFGVCAQAQRLEGPQNQYANDPCGDPTFESSWFMPVRGKVLKVVDGDTVTIPLKNKKRLLIHLVGIDAPALDQPFGRDARRFLERSVLGKKVEVWVSPNDWTFKPVRPKEITGVVYLRDADMLDVNLSLIRAGMAGHKQSQPYTMSNYAECGYVKAEEEARSAKRGIWQGAA